MIFNSDLKKKLYFQCTDPPSRIIREQQDKGNFGYGILVDFQKPFDTSDHDIFKLIMIRYSQP